MFKWKSDISRFVPRSERPESCHVSKHPEPAIAVTIPPLSLTLINTLIITDFRFSELLYGKIVNFIQFRYDRNIFTVI